MIAIKNLKEMPKSCGECPCGSFADGIVCSLSDNNPFPRYVPNVGGTAWGSYRRSRRSDCPLVDIKHGLDSHEHEILDGIYERFCDNVGSYAHNYRVTMYHFTEDAGPYTPNSEITIELLDGSTIKYSVPKD